MHQDLWLSEGKGAGGSSFVVLFSVLHQQATELLSTRACKTTPALRGHVAIRAGGSPESPRATALAPNFEKSDLKSFESH